MNTYQNELAMACFVASNVTACIRSALENDNGAFIVEAWIELECADDKKALAVLRTTLNRVAREFEEFGGNGATVKDGKLVQVKSRAKKKDAAKDQAKKMVEKTATLSPVNRGKVMELIKALEAEQAAEEQAIATAVAA